MLIVDCETITQETLDHPEQMPGFNPDEWASCGQNLLFGCAHLWTQKQNSREWVRESEWTFYPDNLPTETLVKLRRHFSRDNFRVGDWREPTDSPGVKSFFMPLSEFLKVFYRESVSQKCLIAGYNLPWDISRLAYRVGPARSSQYRGGFSFALWNDPTGKNKQNLFRPRFYVKQLGQRSTIMKFSKVMIEPGKPPKFYYPKCELLDLSQFIFSLLGESLSLDRAAEALGLTVRKDKIEGHGIITQDYFRYCRQDVLVTAQVCFAALDKFDKHPISREYNPPGPTSECKVFSGASISKGYFKLMGIKPRLELQPDFSPKVLIASLEAYYGGRSEVRIWNMLVPVAPLDFVSEYPTVASLQGIWSLIIAEKNKPVRCAQWLRKWLKKIKADDFRNPETWKTLNGFARIKPHGEILPVRAKYVKGGSWKIGLNPYFSEPQWYAFADLAVAKIRNPGISFEILEAFRLVPVGIQQGLKPVKFAGNLTIDPTEDNFYQKVVEERQNIKAGRDAYKNLSTPETETMVEALKIFVNTGIYGVFGEVNQKDLAVNATEEMNLWTSDDPDNCRILKTHYPEHPGILFYPPIAALITAGGRLLLAMLQHEVESLGASYALMDTDSLFCTYKQGGGQIEISGSDTPVRLLDDVELNDIINGFDSLNIYDKKTIPHLLKHEYPEFQPLSVLGIGPKRYALFDKSGQAIAVSEFALGGIIPPTDNPGWMFEWWKAIASGEDFPFKDYPLVHKHTIRTWEVYQHVKTINEGKPWTSQIKPFNFLMTMHSDPFMGGSEASPLIGPFNKDPSTWENLPWINKHTGKETFITTDLAKASVLSTNLTCVRTLENYFQDYKGFKPAEFTHPAGGGPGMLRPRPVQRGDLMLIGKESHVFADLVEGGLIKGDFLEVPASIPGTSNVQTIKEGSNHKGEWIKPLSPILKDLSPGQRRGLCKRLRVKDKTFFQWVRLTRKPEDRCQSVVETFCIDFAGGVLEKAGVSVPDYDPNTISIYINAAPIFQRDAQTALKTFVDNFGSVAASREFEIDRRTVRSWIDHPERIPIEKAIDIRKGILS